MKTILFIVFLSIGPNPSGGHQASVWSINKGTEALCLAEVERYERNGRSAGRIGNLPGYRYVHAAWCEDRDEPWEGSVAPLLDGSVLIQGPYLPRDKAERDRWTPLWTPWGGLE